MENLYGIRCVNPIIEELRKGRFDNPANRILLYTLLRLIPTRQTVYESNLTNLLPTWKKYLSQNPQLSLPEEFVLASEISEATDVSYPDGFIDVVVSSIKSSRLDIVLAGLKACEKIGSQTLLECCLNVACKSSGSIKNRAILSAARISHPNTPEFEILKGYVLDFDLPIDLRICAFEAFLKTPRHSCKDVLTGLLQEHGKELQQAAEFINAVLDTSRIDLSQWVNDALNHSNLAHLPQTTIRRVMRSPAVSMDLRQQAATRLHINSGKQKISSDNSRFALLVHRNSGADGVFIGHTGMIKDDNAEKAIHCTVGSDPHAVHSLSFNDWKDGKECWGFREDHDDPVNLQNAFDRAEEIASWRTEYDGSHNNQKGEWFKGWSCAPRYWEADCVGYTEHCYEYAGGNPTPNEFENGAGAPLTPREQRDHMRKVAGC